MSIASEVQRITALKAKIKTALVSWGVVNSSAMLDDCATAIEGLDVHKSIAAEIREGESYTIPSGYHDGSGTVTGVGGGGNYKLQSKSVTPSSTEQTVTSDVGFYGLDSVTVGAIPGNLKDVSSVTATADKVLTGSAFVDSSGVLRNGSMTNVGKSTLTIDGMSATSVTIPKGYHDGTGTASITNSIELALAEI